MYKKEQKKVDAKISVFTFLRKMRPKIGKMVMEILKLSIMLLALQFEIDNFIDYTNGEALLFEPMFVVKAILCLLIIIRLLIMSWKTYKISYKLDVIEDPFPVQGRVLKTYNIPYKNMMHIL